ncbi:MAG: hypothetical protein E7129_00255 [Rikenellaceae bacterium]|nr:hypothetical protein [Rikenellaceae bacterium]
MKRFIKYTFLALIIVATLGLSGCTKQGQQRQRKQKFQVVSLDRVSGSIGEGWNITLTVANNTASNMRITAASAFVRHNGRKIGRMTLDGEVLLPRRRCSQVEVPLRLTLANPLGALALLNKLRKGDFSDVAIDYSITISAFASHRIFEQENVSLEQLAQQFNFGLKK